MTLQEYLDANDLWDVTKLGEHCTKNSVYARSSVKYPGLTLLHYMDEASYGKSWNDFNIMCRGSIIDMRSKKVIAWPFNKFFNLGEHTSTVEEVLKKGDFVATEKLDGSMLILFPYEGRNYFTTKGSFDSEHAEYANSIMPEVLKNLKLDENWTFMFELISEKFRNIINYKKRGYSDGVYLIGIRLPDFQLAPSNFIRLWAETNELHSFKTYDFKYLEKVVETCSILPSSEEGYVLRFDNEQFLVKVKGKDYVIAHKILKGMNDSAIVESMELDKTLEIITYCPEEYREEVSQRFDFFSDLAKKIYDELDIAFCMAVSHAGNDRKRFAQTVNGSVKPEYKKFMFKMFDDTPEPDIYKLIYYHIRQHHIKAGIYTNEKT